MTSSLSLNLGGALLSAAVAGDPADDRVREGIIVPWNEEGRTNLGKAPVRRGAFTAPAGAKMVGIYGHNREASVSRLLSAEDRPEGLWGRFRIGRTQLGDQLLAEIDDGVRDGLSVEASDLVFDADGGIVSGTVDFFAHVPVGAYSSARVATLAASLTTSGEPPVTDPAPAPALTADAVATLIAEAFTAHGIGTVPPAAAGDLQASASLGLPTPGVPAPPSAGPAGGAVHRLATLQASLATGNNSPELRAALADITNTGLDLFQSPAGAVGQELWSGGGYTRRFVPLMAQKELTSWNFGGWRWAQRPEVDTYLGDKAEIPTNPVTVTPVTGEAERLAGGWDIDRKFRDFGDAEFWAGFYAAQTESYSEKSDEIAAAAIVAAARNITTDGNVPAGYTDGNVAQADILRATALGGAILEDTANVRRPADYVLMNPADWLGLMDLTNLDLPAFLSLLGVQPGGFLRSPLVPAGSVILGVTPAMSFYELGGGAPIRVEALDVARAGIDSAVYGYVGTLVNRPGGVISVPLVPAV